MPLVVLRVIALRMLAIIELMPFLFVVRWLAFLSKMFVVATNLTPLVIMIIVVVIPLVLIVVPLLILVLIGSLLVDGLTILGEVPLLVGLLILLGYFLCVPRGLLLVLLPILVVVIGHLVELGLALVVAGASI